MCTFETSAISGLINGAFNLTNSAMQVQQNKKNHEYRMNVALKNAEISKNNALRQQQLGIDKSRLEKISGIKEANLLKAKNAASGIDLNSTTNQQNYDDMLNQSELNASVAKKEYDFTAQNYFNQANSYLEEANNMNRQYNNSVFQNALNALGKAKKVEHVWYENF